MSAMGDLEKLSKNIRRLSEWYTQNKPSVTALSITSKDAMTIRKLLDDKESCMEASMKGFHTGSGGQLMWGSWNLKSPAPVENADAQSK